MEQNRSTKVINDEAKACFRELGEFNPKAFQGFSKYIREIEKDGALPSKMKHILIVALAVSKQCEWCIVYHTRKAMDRGATREELLEACLVTSIMGGGPVMMFTQIVIKTINEYIEEKAEKEQTQLNCIKNKIESNPTITVNHPPVKRNLE